MAIRLINQYPARVDLPSEEFPDGRPRNESVPGANDGTPFEQAWFQDYEGFSQALLTMGDVVRSGTPDTATDSDRLTALMNIIGNSTQVSSLAELQALPAEFQRGAVFLRGRASAGDGGGGLFNWLAGDFTAEIAADPLHGIYVPANDDPTGAAGCWVRASSQLTPQMFGAVGDGVVDDASAFSAAVAASAGGSLYVPDGDYNLSTVPAGIDGVHLYGSSRITWTDKRLPVFSGVLTGGREAAIVAGVIRYYNPGPGGGAAGWYFIKDNDQNHDPVLLGPVSSTADYSVSLDVNFSDLGLDPSLWTPSGFVVGPDETLAEEGVTIGASVGSTVIHLRGSYSAPAVLYVNYNGTAFEVAKGNHGASYVFEWIGSGTDSAHLKVTRTAGGRGWSANRHLGQRMVATPRLSGSLGEPYIPIATGQGEEGGDQFGTFAFYNLSTGARVQSPVSGLRFVITDYDAQNTRLNWTDIASEHGNVWMVGVFVRKPGLL